MYLQRTLIIFISLLSLFIIAPLHAEKDRKVYILAVSPFAPPVTIHRDWAPFVERLSNETGAEIQLNVYSTFTELDDSIKKGIPDFAFLNPYHAVVAKKTQGYIPLVRSEEPLIGILVTRKDSPIESIQDIQGKEIAFPSPSS